MLASLRSNPRTTKPCMPGLEAWGRAGGSNSENLALLLNTFCAAPTSTAANSGVSPMVASHGVSGAAGRVAGGTECITPPRARTLPGAHARVATAQPDPGGPLEASQGAIAILWRQRPGACPLACKHCSSPSLAHYYADAGPSVVSGVSPITTPGGSSATGG